MEPTRLLYTPTEAAQMLGYGRTKVYALMRRGAIESIKDGRHRRIPADALKEYVERKRREAAPIEAMSVPANRHRLLNS